MSEPVLVSVFGNVGSYFGSWILFVGLIWVLYKHVLSVMLFMPIILTMTIIISITINEYF